MYKANLNFERFDKYFQELLKKGLVEEQLDSDGKTAYLISKRGKTLLDCLRKAREIFGASWEKFTDFSRYFILAYVFFVLLAKGDNKMLNMKTIFKHIEIYEF